MTLFSSFLKTISSETVANNFVEGGYAPRLVLTFTIQDWKTLGATSEEANRLVASNRMWRLASQHTIPTACETPKDLFHAVANLTVGRKHEVLVAVYLDSYHRLISVKLSTMGDTDSTTVNIKGILGEGLRIEAAAIAIAHNHPSGDLKPSEQDIELTKQISESCLLMDFEFLDHLIVGNNYEDFYSMRNQPEYHWCFDDPEVNYPLRAKDN